MSQGMPFFCFKSLNWQFILSIAMPKRLSLLLLLVCTLNTLFAQNLSRSIATQAVVEALDSEKVSHKAELEQIWTQKSVTQGNLEMKFAYRILGEKHANGRSLYISLHGGGNTSVAANDQQWKNQINLYTPKEGVYLAPRAPTNTWNLWHEDHIDDMLATIIKAAVVNEGVNPNKVYVLGYSAGGDGTFQLAPRMADYWAAAAIMAGHPGDASALSLRNLPFAIYMGGADAAYKRNELAKVWGDKLDSLQAKNPGSYVHDVHIFEGLPHWMNRRDTIAIPWLASFTRKALPAKVAWQQDDRHHEQFYWLGTPSPETGKEAIVSVSKNSISIEKNDNTALYIYLNDQLLNLDKKIKVIENGKVIFNKKAGRKRSLIQATAKRLDPDLVFSARLLVKDGKVTEE
jgi:dienelactone hydrolase